MIIPKKKFALILSSEILIILIFFAFYFFNINQFESLLKAANSAETKTKLELIKKDEYKLTNYIKRMEHVTPENRLFNQKTLANQYLFDLYISQNKHEEAAEIIKNILNDQSIINDCPFLVHAAQKYPDFSPLLEECLIQDPSNYEANKILSKNNPELISKYNQSYKKGHANLNLLQKNLKITSIRFQTNINGSTLHYSIPLIPFEKYQNIEEIIYHSFSFDQNTSNHEITNFQIIKDENSTPIYISFDLKLTKKSL